MHAKNAKTSSSETTVKNKALAIGMMLLVLSAAMALFLPRLALASDTAYYANAPAGTEDHPLSYSVGSEDELAALATTVNGGVAYPFTTFTLTNDIQISSDHNGSTAGNWDPMGTSIYNSTTYLMDNHFFEGTLDGNGHSITNLQPLRVVEQGEGGPRDYYAGLFFGIGESCVIKDLTIDGAITIQDSSYVEGANGTIMAYAGAFAACADGGTLINCMFTGSLTVGASDNLFGFVQDGQQGGTIYAGGLVGDANAVHARYATYAGLSDTAESLFGMFSLYGCTNAATISCYVSTVTNYASGESYVGGLVGDLSATSGEIARCSNNGSVSLVQDGYGARLGGLVGSMSVDNGGDSSPEGVYTFDACANTGAISYTYAPAGDLQYPNITLGGLVGTCIADAAFGNQCVSVLDCSNTGMLAVGGEESQAVQTTVGGLAGKAESVSFVNSVGGFGTSALSLSGYTEAGGIAGVAEQSTFENCYASGTLAVSDHGRAGGIVGYLGGGGYCKDSYSDMDISVLELTTGGTWTDKSVYVGGIAGAIDSTLNADHPDIISGCHNGGDVQGVCLDNGKAPYGNDTKVYVGGIAGTSVKGNITDCLNEGKVSGYSITTSYIGGILGTNGFSPSAVTLGSYVNIVDCENLGVVGDDVTHASAPSVQTTYIGGIAGNLTGEDDTTSSGCVNHGNIVVSTTADGTAGYKTAHVGGLFGAISCSEEISGINTGDMQVAVPGSAGYLGEAYVGGAVGYEGTFSDESKGLHDFSVFCDIDVATVEGTSASVGGVFGRATCEIYDCSHVGNISAKSASGQVGGLVTAAGIIASPYYSVNNCFNWGDVSVSLTEGNTYNCYACAAGVAGNIPYSAEAGGIRNCTQAGNVSASVDSSNEDAKLHAYAGGIACTTGGSSDSWSNVEVVSNYMAGTVTSASAGGSIVGEESSPRPGNTVLSSSQYSTSASPFTLNSASRSAMLSSRKVWVADYATQTRSYSDWVTNGTYGWTDFGVSEPQATAPYSATKIAAALDGFATEHDLQNWEVSDGHIQFTNSCNPTIVAPAFLPSGVKGTAYAYTLSAIGVGDMAFEKSNGDLPAGMSLRNDGLLSGTPQKNGAYTFTVRVSDAKGSSTQTFTLNVYDTLPAHYVSVGCNAGGSITPQGRIGVADGGSLTIYLAIDDGYMINDPVISTDAKYAFEKQGDGTYKLTLSDIRGDVLVYENFERLWEYPQLPTEAIAKAGYKQVKLTWTASDTSRTAFPIDHYIIYRGGYSIAQVSANSALEYIDTDVTVGNSYQYEIASVDTNGTRSSLTEDFRDADLGTWIYPYQEPDAISTLAATGYSSQIDLSWDEPTSYRSDITSYTIYRKSGSGSFVQVGTSQHPYYCDRDAALGTGVTYTYKVTATNDGGTSADSNLASTTLDTTKLSAPRNAKAVATLYTNTSSAPEAKVTLSWSAPASGTAASYNVYSASMGSYAKVNDEPITTTSFIDTNSGAGYGYWYCVTAVDGSGVEGARTDMITGTVPDPRVYFIEDSLTFTYTSGDTPDAQTFSVTNMGNCTTTVSAPGVTGDFLHVTGGSITIAPGETKELGSITADASKAAGTYTEYIFCTYTYKENGTTTQEITPTYIKVKVTVKQRATVPSAPSSLSSVAGDSKVTLSWTPSASDGTKAITAYNVYRSDVSGTLGTLAASVGAQTISGSGTFSVTDNNVNPNTTYYYTVKAVNSLGESPASNVSSATPWGSGPSVPGAPQDVSAKAGDKQATISWKAPASDGGSAVTGYIVYRGGTQVGTVTAGTTSYTDTGLENGKEYSYTVAATNAKGTSGKSAAVTVVPRAVTVPDAPQDVSATAGDGQVSLSWSAPADDGGSAVTGYIVYRGGTQVGTVTAGTTSYTDAGLVNGKEYSYTVAATNAKGTGGESESASATPKVEAVVTRLSDTTALGTMVKITSEGWDEGGCSTVVVATMDGYWDALSASALAGLDSNDCPVLITSGTSLSQQAASEIKRLGADKVYIAGGKAAVSEGVKGSIEALGVSTERLSGDNAVGTSLDIYEEGTKAGANGTNAWGKTCIVATNDGYWDALAASPFAYDQHAPIFLYNAGAGRLDEPVVDAIRDGGFTRVIVCGGKGAVKDTVETQLNGLGSVTAVDRYGGKTAVETSALIAQACLDAGMHADGVAVATNGGYWDALTGAALCGKNASSLVLASDDNRGAITGFVADHKADIFQAYVFGGTAAVSDATYDAVVAALK